MHLGLCVRGGNFKQDIAMWQILNSYTRGGCFQQGIQQVIIQYGSVYDLKNHLIKVKEAVCMMQCLVDPRANIMRKAVHTE